MHKVHVKIKKLSFIFWILCTAKQTSVCRNSVIIIQQSISHLIYNKKEQKHVFPIYMWRHCRCSAHKPVRRNVFCVTFQASHLLLVIGCLWFLSTIEWRFKTEAIQPHAWQLLVISTVLSEGQLARHRLQLPLYTFENQRFI